MADDELGAIFSPKAVKRYGKAPIGEAKSTNIFCPLIILDPPSSE
jgi:hypothetical protein